MNPSTSPMATPTPSGTESVVVERGWPCTRCWGYGRGVWACCMDIPAEMPLLALWVCDVLVDVLELRLPHWHIRPPIIPPEIPAKYPPPQFLQVGIGFPLCCFSQLNAMVVIPILYCQNSTALNNEYRSKWNRRRTNFRRTIYRTPLLHNNYRSYCEYWHLQLPPPNGMTLRSNGNNR